MEKYKEETIKQSPEEIERNRVKSLEIEIENLEEMLETTEPFGKTSPGFKQYLKDEIANKKRMVSDPEYTGGIRGGYVNDPMDYSCMMDYPCMIDNPSCNFWDHPITTNAMYGRFVAPEPNSGTITHRDNLEDKIPVIEPDVVASSKRSR